METSSRPPQAGLERQVPLLLGDLVQWHPHGHLILTDGAFSDDGRFHLLATWDGETVMKLFRERLTDASGLPAEPAPAKKRCSPSWARLISKVYQADPLVCRSCGGPLEIVAYITDELSITRILAHLGLSPPQQQKPPPTRELVRVPVDDEGRELQAGREQHPPRPPSISTFSTPRGSCLRHPRLGDVQEHA